MGYLLINTPLGEITDSQLKDVYTTTEKPKYLK